MQLLFEIFTQLMPEGHNSCSNYTTWSIQLKATQDNSCNAHDSHYKQKILVLFLFCSRSVLVLLSFCVGAWEPLCICKGIFSLYTLSHFLDILTTALLIVMLILCCSDHALFLLSSVYICKGLFSLHTLSHFLVTFTISLADCYIYIVCYMS